MKEVSRISRPVYFHILVEYANFHKAIMKLNWLRLFEKIDKDKMQEYFIEEKQKMIYRGQIYVFCPGCRRWVSQWDYEDYCKQGFHEYARELDIHEDSLPPRD